MKENWSELWQYCSLYKTTVPIWYKLLLQQTVPNQWMQTKWKFKVGAKLKKYDLSNTSADISSPGTTNNNTFLSHRSEVVNI